MESTAGGTSTAKGLEHHVDGADVPPAVLYVGGAVMLESEVKKVREQKVREAEYLYMKLRNYIKHSYPNVIEIAANSADDHQHINDIHDRLERALHVLQD